MANTMHLTKEETLNTKMVPLFGPPRRSVRV